MDAISPENFPVIVFVPETAHPAYFKFKICGILNHPLKLSHPVHDFQLHVKPGIEYQGLPIDAICRGGLYRG